MEDKTKLRVTVRRKFTENRRQLPVLSQAVNKKLEKHQIFIASKIVALYWSLPDEVSTHNLIIKWHQHKTILLPSIQDDSVILKEFRGSEDLVAGQKFRIPEPSGSVFNDFTSIDLIVVPGMAFDKNFNRMGRGRGFYDRLLPELQCPKIGLCYPFQYFDKIPSESHDIKVDDIIF